MKFRIWSLVAVSLCWYAFCPAPPQVDEEVANKAIAAFKQGIDASNINERVAAVKALRDADCRKATVLLVDILNDEDPVIPACALEMLKGFHAPESIGYLVTKGLESRKSRQRMWCAIALGYHRDAGPSAVEALLALLKKEKKPEVKAGIIRALGRLRVEEAGPQILKAVKDKSLDVRIEAAYALARIKPEGALTALIGLLYDPVWQVRLEATHGLFKFRDPETVPVFIKRLPEEKGRLKEDILSGLSDMTARNFELDYEAWEKWWSENRETFLANFDPDRKKKVKKKREYAKGVSYYNIRTYSKRFYFVLDISGSMLGEFLPAKSYDYGLTQIPRIDLAKQELLKMIESMSEDTAFNIIYFASHATPWKNKLESAKKRNKNDAVKFVENIDVQPRGMNTLTNLYDALDIVLAKAEELLHKKTKEEIGDTLFLLSDGVPFGENWLTDRDAIVWTIRERNRHLKIRIHTISLAGDMETPRFLTALSKPSGGEMKNVLTDD